MVKTTDAPVILEEIILPAEKKPSTVSDTAEATPQYETPESSLNQAMPYGPIQQYINSNGGPYFPGYNYYPGFYSAWSPYPYMPQQPYAQQQQQQNTQAMPPTYASMQPEYEGILVPVQTLSQPSHVETQAPTQMAQTQPLQTYEPQPQQQQIQQLQPPTQPQQQLLSQMQPHDQLLAQVQQLQNTLATSKHSETKPPMMTSRTSFDLAMLLQALLPPAIIQLIIAIGNFILNSFSTLAFAGVITSLLCAFTPLCTLSFAALPFGVRRALAANITEGNTIHRVRRAAEIVSHALEKFEKIQKGVENLTNSLQKSQKKF